MDELNHMNTYNNGAPADFSLRRHPAKGELATRKHLTYHFFKNRNLEWWLLRVIKPVTYNFPNHYDPKILELVLPSAVGSVLGSGLINSSEAENLLGMLKSPDKENLTIAIIAIIRLKKDQIKLNKFTKHGRK